MKNRGHNKFLVSFLEKNVAFVSFFVYSGYYALLAIIIAVLGADSSRLVSVPIRLLTTVIMVLVIVFTSFYFKEKSSKRKSIYYFVFFVFWMLYILKLLYHYSADYPLRSSWIEYLLYAVNFSILPFVMFSTISFEKYKRIIINSIIFSGFVMGATTLYLYKDLLTLGIGLRSAISLEKFGDALSPLALSYASVLTLILCMYKLLFGVVGKKWEYVYLYMTIVFSLAMFLFGASRGSILAFAFSLVYLIAQSNLVVKIKTVLSLVLATPLFLWGVEFTGSSILQRTSNSVESGTTGRERLWIDAWTEFLNYPFLGNRIEIGYHPHNIFMETLMGMGLVGFIILVAMVFITISGMFKLPKVNRDYIWVSLIFIQGICQSLFSGSIVTATLVFFPMSIILANLSKTYFSRPK
ncbi:O-antigen ligase family protein [Poritiphilus flavus]|uniref:O-antigen ligase-related domain-containing protein n=1 Tax=Poritiphilus flavus TaxID=2697053 RepID=A0A6L9E9Y0_9FLAO|nr:O-antigen ligase family protein [Poritiphilus flavus]NAS11516.1 hypothetical protein [Poritiphilus flavus]